MTDTIETGRPGPLARLSRFARTPKGQLAGVFLALLAVAGGAASLSTALPHVLACVAGAVVVDLIAGRAAGRGWRWPSSALLSGLIVAFVLGLETPLLVGAAVGALASASKLVLATGRGHVFNPAGLALLAAVPLFGAGESWWGALADMPALWALLLLAGGVWIVDRVNKFPIALSFMAGLYGPLTLIALARPTLVAELFRAPFIQSSLFLAAFMLTDPPTSPGRAADQVWMGVLAGLVAAIAQLAGAGQLYLLLGLLAVNVALAVQRWRQGRQHRGGVLAGGPPDQPPLAAAV